MATSSRRLTRRALVIVGGIVIVAWWLIGMLSRGSEGGAVADLFPHGALRVGIDPSNPPFASASGEDVVGLDADIAHELARRLGVPVRFVWLGYDGLYDALRVDSVDVVISSLRIDPLRREDVLYSTPYFNAGLVLVSDAHDAYADMAAVSGRALAYEFGSTGEAEARRWLRRVLPYTLRPYELTPYALDAVRVGEADAALVDAISARLYLRDHAAWDAHVVGVYDTWYALATRRDRGDVWQAVNYHLDEMLADGTIERLIDDWFSQPDKSDFLTDEAA